MSDVLSDLLSLLELEKLEESLFRGRSQDIGLRNVFGGQVIGQALSASRQTVENDRSLHSFHSYFTLPGDANKPIVYNVENIRDGRSISTRRIKAIQNGKTIFFMTASFHREAEGFDHQATMPNVAMPENLSSELEFNRLHADKIPEAIRKKFTCDRPIEMRPVEVYNPLKPKKSDPFRNIWMKAVGNLPDDPGIHMYLLAYASDFGFLVTAGQPHGVSLMTPKFQMATIDHSMWFHRKFRFDDWLLYNVESPSASNERGFVQGKIFNRDGELVASSAQEGIMRFAK